MFLEILPHLSKFPRRHFVRSKMRHAFRFDLTRDNTSVEVVLLAAQVQRKSPELALVPREVSQTVNSPQLLLDLNAELCVLFLVAFFAASGLRHLWTLKSS